MIPPPPPPPNDGNNGENAIPLPRTKSARGYKLTTALFFALILMIMLVGLLVKAGQIHMPVAWGVVALGMLAFVVALAGWTQPSIEALHGRQVKVVGQLLADADHNENTQDCAYSNRVTASCWRASTWELHPVTRLYACTQGKTCSATSTTDWQEIP